MYLTVYAHVFSLSATMKNQVYRTCCSISKYFINCRKISDDITSRYMYDNKSSTAHKSLCRPTFRSWLF